MHIHDDVLELYLNEGLESAFVSKVESHLGFCESCSARLVEAASFMDQMSNLNTLQSAPDGNENRRLARIATNDPATIQQVNPFSANRTDVCVLDISQGGLGIHSSVSLWPGNFVKVRIRSAIAFGVVRYCVTRENGFHVGVLLQDLFSV